ncbi:hypothetical protein F5X99DRAFT_425174 [Biscogniauxia marginata]|nr:hypothetical protein F5X99DRAFT_425174 [Biscogniauxia marginata]
MDYQSPQSIEDASTVVKTEQTDLQPLLNVPQAPAGQVNDLEPGEVIDDRQAAWSLFEQDNSCFGSVLDLNLTHPPAVKHEDLDNVLDSVWGTPSAPRQPAYNRFSQFLGPPTHHHAQHSTGGLGNPQVQPEKPQARTAREARNEARLQEIVTRLQYVQGSVDDLLELASIQRQIDRAWEDMNRAQNQLKSVLGQFQLEGCFTDKQSRRKNAATKDMTRCCQQIVSLVNQLSRCRRQQIQSKAAKAKGKGSS